MSTWRCIRCGDVYEAHQTFCAGCFASGSIVCVGHRHRATLDFVAEVSDARQLAKQSIEYVPARPYPRLRIGVGALVCVYGEPGARKSTFVTRLLDSLQGPVVLVATEEGVGPALGQRLQRLRVSRPTFHIVGRSTVDGVVDVLRRTSAIAVAVDSVQSAVWRARELRHLFSALPKLRVVIGVSQVNTAGGVHGGAELPHESDVVIRVEAHADRDESTYTVEKSRFQAVNCADATGDVMGEEEVSDAAQ